MKVDFKKIDNINDIDLKTPEGLYLCSAIGRIHNLTGESNDEIFKHIQGAIEDLFIKKTIDNGS